MEGPGRETKDGREQQHDGAGRGEGGRGGYGSPSLNGPLGLVRRGAADRLGTMHGGGRFATPDSRVGEYRGQGMFSLLCPFLFVVVFSLSFLFVFISSFMVVPWHFIGHKAR